MFMFIEEESMNLKKVSLSLLAATMLVGCGSSTASTGDATEGSKEIDELNLEFVPSRDPGEIVSATKDLGQLLIDKMAEKGYTIGNVNIAVSDTYEAAGEALAAGSVDVAWLPGGTYALYSDETEVILTATRAGLSNDSETPADWNGEANKTLKNGDPVTYYRSLIYATPSKKGQELAAKVNAGEELSWEDIASAKWAVMNVSSSAGYIYPTMWLMDHYDGKTFNDINTAGLGGSVTTLDGYATAFMQAAAEQVDVICCYADGRNDYEGAWNLATTEQDEANHTGLGRTSGKSIWDELNVIGVTDKIYNDTVAVTKANPDIYNDDFKAALQDSLIELAGTEEGSKIFSIYSHTGYAKATDADYDSARAALKVVTE